MKSKRVRFQWLFLLTLAFFLVSVGQVLAQDVRTEYMRGVDFSKYHTYKWLPPGPGVPMDQIIDSEIKQSVDGQLASKGLTKTDSDQADLYVGYHVGIDKERQWNAQGLGGGPGFGWGPWGGGMATATSSSIDVGTLVLDMYDPPQKQLVWSAHATKTLELSKNQDKNRKTLDKGVAKLLKDFPPRH